MKTGNIILLFLVILGIFGHCEGGKLRKHFYKKSCPKAEDIVKTITLNHVSRNLALPAKLLRLHFHDCFVRGCDASVLLNSTANNTAEKDAGPNAFMEGFDIIDDAKTQLEKTCPGVVSCADIVALATRDAVSFVSQVKKPLWKVLTGRRDGTVSLASEVILPNNIPFPTMNFTSLEQNFVAKGLTVHDLVVLSGAHSIGVGHCFLVRDRLYNFTGRGDADPSLDPTYATFLRRQCPRNPADFATTVEMDPRSSRSFDKNYYVNLKRNRGLFESDAALLTHKGSRNIVNELTNTKKFFTEFSQSMKRLAAVGVLTGKKGEIRRKCSVVNS